MLMLSMLNFASITLILYLLVYLPALHSFPTRRSSDLLHSLDDALRVRAVIEQTPAARVLIYGAGFIGAETAGILNQDRKSTRLNSSHVAISYAVFCVKKKKSMVLLGSLIWIVVLSDPQ